MKNDWYAHISPAGKNLLLMYMPEAESRRLTAMSLELLRKQEIEYSFEWINLETLQVAQSWTAKNWMSPYSMAISDGGIVRYGIVTDGEKFVAKIGELPNGPWRQMDSPMDSYQELLGQFINNKTILNMRFVGGVDKNTKVWMGVVSTTGELLYQETFAKGEISFDGSFVQDEAGQKGVVFSSGGQRFALALAKIKGANTTLDIGGHLSLDRIMVYDVPNRRWIYTLDAKAQRIKSVSGMALSPDGSLLALINQDGILEVYRVPETPNPRAIQ